MTNSLKTIGKAIVSMGKKNEDVILSLPKGDLHVHLNGLISTERILEILQEENVALPIGFDLAKDLTRTVRCSSLQEYLKPWDVLRLIPNRRHSLKILIDSAFENLNKINVRFIEIRSTVLYIGLLNSVSPDVALRWLLEDLNECSTKYGVNFGLILTTPRGDYSLTHFQTLINAYESLGRPADVIGLDLAGNEDTPISDELGKCFYSAKNELGLGVTIHAGETGRKENIISAIKDFGADRIGHGTAAGYCDETMELIVKYNICLEVCPISNRLTGAVKENESHPLIQYMKYNVPFVICSDNPSIHQNSLLGDYMEFYRETDDVNFLKGMFERQQKYSFLNENKVYIQQPEKD